MEGIESTFPLPSILLIFCPIPGQVKNYSHDLGKEVRRVPKRQQLASDGEGPSRRSALNVRRFLQEFCVEFLENCYNRLMYLVKVRRNFKCGQLQDTIKEKRETSWPSAALVYRTGQQLHSLGLGWLH